ncbi:MAG: threonylcarbamoyl-AMP synthase [Rhodocyclales bacterium]|nr:threonylcarbamoyl-AMP synthase [Rhodocyclales bacterium]
MSNLADIARAVELLQAGELVGIPTETVYGLGADAANPEAVAKIFVAKGRPADHPLIVHIPGANFLDRWARDIPDLAYELAEDFWPGPLTLILKRAPGVPDAVTGGQDTVGLRVPGHPVALDLLRAFAAAGGSGGIAAPSANRFGRISPTTAGHVREELGDAVALVLDGGPCAVGIESTIVDLSSGKPLLLRPGHITPAAIEAVCGVLPEAPTAAAPRASGTLEAHYAPTTPMRRVDRDRLAQFLNAMRHSGRRCGVLAHSQPPQAVSGPNPPHLWKMLPAAPDGYAHDLYAALRELDHAGVDLIVVEAIPETPEWQAVADRLRRALAGAGA